MTIKKTEKEIQNWKKDQEEIFKEYDEIRERVETQKDYILTVYQMGCKLMSHGDPERQVSPSRFYVPVSIDEIQDYTKFLTQSFWTHPDTKNPKVKNKDIPHEEKKWGRYSDVIIEPLSEDLQKRYLDGVEKGFFDVWRRFSEKKVKEIA